jgi:hypothetical protein
MSPLTRRSAEGPSFKVPSALKFLGEAEIDELDVASHVEEEIFRLKISAKTKTLDWRRERGRESAHL